MSNRLTGKVAVVTGAAQGIGAAIAEDFRAEGALVTATDIQFSAQSGEQISLDVTSEQAWKQVIDAVVARYSRIDILVNNAGGGAGAPPGPIHLISPGDWQKVIDVNQLSTFLGIRQVVPVMMAHGGGSIVNISSVLGSRAIEAAAAYHASKAAILNMTRNAAITYAPDNIRVNAILPGFIRTPFTDNQDTGKNNQFLDRTPLGRPGEGSDVAKAATFFASDDASFVTGTELAVDGGYLAG